MRYLICFSLLLPLLAADYVIVVSPATRAAWPDVVAALETKHAGARVLEAKRPDAALTGLREEHPRHTCFVARPSEVTRDYVAEVHRLTRKLDADPYTDTLWGILTGYNRSNALMIAREAEPLVIRKVGSGTEVALEMCEEGQWFCELKKNRKVVKAKGGEARQEAGPDDTTRALAASLTDFEADLFVTSGHATERDWQIGYSYKNGSFRSKDGVLYGRPLTGEQFAIRSEHARVYMPIGNCLMGHIDGADAMALAWMNSAGVRQMLGYTVPTWFGYQGWGVLDMFVEQPGRFTYTEAFFANHHALIHRLENRYPELAQKNPPVGKVVGGYNEGGGLLFDRDVVAFYGDPAWSAKMAPGVCAWEQKLEMDGNRYTLTLTPNRGANSFKPVNTNGAQRGGRPVVQLLPQRIGAAKLIEGADLKPVITDDFILIPHDERFDLSRDYRVVFMADPAG